ncbi:MAG: DUF3097 domain-containing protein [Actinobacteria bacterium]|nr:DUF3097 domain-containing protein [Actinomycetota bacterium]
MTRDRYGDDVLATGGGHRSRVREVALRPGLTVEVSTDGFVGQVTGATARTVTLRDRRGRERTFELHPGAFFVDDVPATLMPPTPRPPATDEPRITPSGSFALPGAPARVARGSRIFVEGKHDAELVEKVWGDDLRVEGLVVEYLEGIDDLADVVRRFGPSVDRRLGVLVDHLVPGTKEARIAAAVSGPHVLVTGHPFVDVWAAVKPSVVGVAAWPEVPRGEDWKTGVCRELGVEAPWQLWQRILASVSRYTDLEVGLVGAVEELIDFCTEPG